MHGQTGNRAQCRCGRLLCGVERFKSHFSQEQGEMGHPRTECDQEKMRPSLPWLLYSTLIFLCLTATPTLSQEDQKTKTPPTPEPMLADGTVSFKTPDLELVLVR